MQDINNNPKNLNPNHCLKCGGELTSDEDRDEQFNDERVEGMVCTICGFKQRNVYRIEYILDEVSPCTYSN